MSKDPWKQSWVHSVTSSKFRNFMVPRISLLRRLQGAPPTHQADIAPAEEKEAPFAHSAAYNDPFDNIQFAVSMAANLRQVPGDAAHSPYGPSLIRADNSDSSGSSFTSRTASSSQPGSRGGCHAAFRITLQVIAFLAVVAVITVAVYFKLSSGKGSEDPSPNGYAVAMGLKLTNQEFIPELRIQSSEEFQAFQNMFCSNMTALYSGSTQLGSYKGCSVDQVRNGSALDVTFTLFFLGDDAPSVTDLVTSLTKGSQSAGGTVTLASGLTMMANSVEIVRVSAVPGDQFIGPNVPVSVTTANPTSSTGQAGTTVSVGVNVTAGSNATDTVTSDPANDTWANSTTEVDANSTASPTTEGGSNSTDSSNSTDGVSPSAPTGNWTDSANSTNNSTDASDWTNSTDSSNSTDGLSPSAPTGNWTDSANSTNNSTDASDWTNSTVSSNATDNSTGSSAQAPADLTNSTDYLNSTDNSTDSTSSDRSNSTMPSNSTSNDWSNSTTLLNSTYDGSSNSTMVSNSTYVDCSNFTMFSNSTYYDWSNSTMLLNSTHAGSSNSTMVSNSTYVDCFNSTMSSNSTG